MAHSNWYAFGLQAWNKTLASDQIADERVKLTFGQKPEPVAKINEIMHESQEEAVNYMMPLGLHHIMGRSLHYGPGPWVEGGRADWTALYYHRAVSLGIGFDRTAAGSNALAQYAPDLAQTWSDPNQIPEKYPLWFHNVSCNSELKSGKKLWKEIALHYDQG